MAAAWVVAQFAGAKRFAYAGRNHYGLTLQFQSLDFTVASIDLDKVRVYGCEGLLIGRTPMAFAGTHYSGEITRDPWFCLARVHGFTNGPLPPPVKMPDGSVIYTQNSVRGWRIGIPYWSFVLAGSVVTIMRVLPRVHQAVAQWRYSVLARDGHCGRCGYDLCATPHRCPECGHLPSTAGIAPPATI